MSIRKVVVLLGTVVMTGLGAWAQSDYPKVEAAGDFSLVHFNPSKRFTSSHNLFGGGGGITYNFTKFIGVKADLQGYGSQTSNFFIPAGTRIGTAVTSSNLAFAASGTLFTYLFGPQIKLRASHFEPFGQVLFGGAHSNVYANAFRQVGRTVTGIGAAPSNNAFSMLVGGGLDIKVAHTIALRPAEIGYLLTRFPNIAGSNVNQNSFRYSAGVVFRFGGGL